MNCLFCQQEMWSDKDSKQPLFFIHNSCCSIKCMVNNDFPRYICGTDKEGSVVYQEYAVDNFYVKVSDIGSRIYTLRSCVLDNEVTTPEPLWINAINLQARLDKVKGLHYILWNG